MKDIWDLYNKYVNKISDLYKTNPSISDFYKGCMGFDNWFIDGVRKLNLVDPQGIYAKCFVVAKLKGFDENEIQDKINSLPAKKTKEYFDEMRKNPVYQALLEFKSDLSTISEYSDEKAKSEYEKCKMKATSGINIPDGIKLSEDYCNGIIPKTNSPVKIR